MSEYEKKLRRIDSVFPDLPEAVEEGYFMEPRLQPGPAKAGAHYTIGSFQRWSSCQTIPTNSLMRYLPPCSSRKSRSKKSRQRDRLSRSFIRDNAFARSS